MTAVSDLVMEQVNSKMRTWKMPEAVQGDRVFWYPGRNYGPGRGVLSVVTDVGDAWVDLVTMGKGHHLQLKREVRHASDPRLEIGDDWLANGTWDVIPPSHADRTIQGRIRALEQKIARCEDTDVETRKEITDIKKLIAKAASAS